MLSGASDEDKVREAFAGTEMELIESSLTAEQAAELRKHFGHEEAEYQALNCAIDL